MSNIKSSMKHALKSKKLRIFNNSRKSMMRTFIKKVYFSIQKNDKIQAQNNWINLQSVLDRLVSKNIIHKNKSSRYKSRLYFKIKRMV
ncbi:30S ribosomal protein S20 [Buchnera aphidicola (Pterocallis alni)]|uniref:30S ribosomal protein S20 n=1 Tax=Buchnera aphidicola TaxID=9 RepID=UPI003463F7FE